MKKSFLTTTLTTIVLSSSLTMAQPWQEVTAEAKGQTVYFHAWGGSETINDYINWAAREIAAEYNVTLRHVRITDAGNVVSQILSEKTAGKDQGGAVDLIWINGENFRAMKDNGLLYGSFTQDLPNYALVDTENKPTTLFDFTTPVDNMEAPWGMAQLVFMYDSARVTTPPSSMLELLAYAKQNPGRVTYPAPPAFHGTTFLKQALTELIDDTSVLYKPVQLTDFDKVTEPLWAFLDELHPVMWRNGRTFTSGAPEMKQLLDDGEINISLSFNPNDASNAIAMGELPSTVRSYVHSIGSIGNTHFVAIPYNTSNAAGAKVVANFLMSPEAQARKANIDIWGDPTVLAMDKLTPAQRQLFANLPQGAAPLTEEELSKVLREPDPSWVDAIERAWLGRYAN